MEVALELARVSLARKSLSMRKLDSNLEFFWQTMVRDAGVTRPGWLDEYKKFKTENQESSYFFGAQRFPDLRNESVRKYIDVNLRVRQRFLNDWKKAKFLETIDSFREWLIQLHKIQAYKGDAGVLRLGSGIPTRRHTWIILGEVIPLAYEYADSYTLKTVCYITPLKWIDKSEAPYDVWCEDESFVFHHYPKAEAYNSYLEVMRMMLLELHEGINTTSVVQVIAKISVFLQYASCLHFMKKSNHVLYMNIVNCLLGLLNLNGIEHGILDFVASRFGEDAFCRYFLDEIKRTNVLI